VTETAEQYAERVLAYVMKATKEVDLHDPALEKAVVKEEVKPEPVNPFDAMLKAFETRNAETPEMTIDEYKAKILKDLKK
jgi:hypothetical protein